MSVISVYLVKSFLQFQPSAFELYLYQGQTVDQQGNIVSVLIGTFHAYLLGNLELVPAPVLLLQKFKVYALAIVSGQLHLIPEYFSPAYTILKANIEINNTFFKYYFKKESFIRQLSNTVVGIRDGKQISYDAFSGMKLIFPSVGEQAKIGRFLTFIDNKVDLITKQLEQARQFKKGLLQQMFV